MSSTCLVVGYSEGAALARGFRIQSVLTWRYRCVQPDCPIIYASDAFCKLTGYARDELVGRNCRFLQGPGTSAAQVSIHVLSCLVYHPQREQCCSA